MTIGYALSPAIGNVIESKISGSLRKQGIGVSPIVQQNQEFSIQNEDFPALPGFKGVKVLHFLFHLYNAIYAIEKLL